MKNRWMQLAGSLVAMVMIANLQYGWTLFVKPMQAATGWTLPQIQWAFTLFILFQTWVQPLEGWLIDKIGPRFFITIAGVLCGGGWSLMGSARTPVELYIYYCTSAQITATGTGWRCYDPCHRGRIVEEFRSSSALSHH